MLTEFVLVRLEPVEWEEDASFGKRFGVEKYPALLALDWKGEKALATVGDESPGKVAATLRAALER